LKENGGNTTSFSSISRLWDRKR